MIFLQLPGIRNNQQLLKGSLPPPAAIQKSLAIKFSTHEEINTSLGNNSLEYHIGFVHIHTPRERQREAVFLSHTL